MVNNDVKTTSHEPPDTTHPLVEMGVFCSPHGVRGQIKLRSFTANPEDLTAYGPLQDKQGKTYAITVTGQTGGFLLASIEGVNSRNDAEALKNTTLYVQRKALPKPKKGEYYYTDLMQMNVITSDGKPFGKILSVHDFGAGTLVNIGLATGGDEFFSFNPTLFPTVDVEKKQAVICPPEIVIAKEE